MLTLCYSKLQSFSKETGTFVLSGSKRVIRSNIFKPITFPNLNIFYLVFQAEPWLPCVKHNGMHGQSSSVKIEAEEKTIVKSRVSTQAHLVSWSFLNEKWGNSYLPQIYSLGEVHLLLISCISVESRGSSVPVFCRQSVSCARVVLGSFSWQVHEQMAVVRFGRVVVIFLQFS